MEDSAQSLRDVWGRTTKANTCVVRVPVEEKGFCAEKTFEDTVAENSSNLAKDL